MKDVHWLAFLMKSWCKYSHLEFSGLGKGALESINDKYYYELFQLLDDVHIISYSLITS